LAGDDGKAEGLELVLVWTAGKTFGAVPAVVVSIGTTVGSGATAFEKAGSRKTSASSFFWFCGLGLVDFFLAILRARFAISLSSLELNDDRDEAFDDPGLLLSSSNTTFAALNELFSPEIFEIPDPFVMPEISDVLSQSNSDSSRYPALLNLRGRVESRVSNLAIPLVSGLFLKGELLTRLLERRLSVAQPVLFGLDFLIYDLFGRTTGFVSTVLKKGDKILLG
jgi:hypothetical protein